MCMAEPYRRFVSRVTARMYGKWFTSLMSTPLATFSWYSLTTFSLQEKKGDVITLHRHVILFNYEAYLAFSLCTKCVTAHANVPAVLAWKANNNETMCITVLSI